MAQQRNIKSTTMNRAANAIKAQALRDSGLTVEMIGVELNLTPRTVFGLLADLKAGKIGADALVPEFKPWHALSKEAQARIRFTADAFEAFFNEYSAYPKWPGTNSSLSPLHRRWVELAIDKELLLVNVPPRHAKSEIFSVWFPIWLTAGAEANRINPENPDEFGLRNVQILLISQTDKLVKKFANKIAWHLGNNQKLIADYGRFRPEMADWPWRPGAGELMVDMRTRDTESGDMTVQIRGSGQQLLGLESNWIICDDPVSREAARSETEREKLSEWFHGDVMTRLEPEGRAIVCGQRIHPLDLYGELAGENLDSVDDEEDYSWEHINFPCVLDWQNKVTLWPEKWTWQRVMKVYKRVGKDIFEAMYQQNPAAAGGRLALDEWLYGNAEYPGCTDNLRSAGPYISGVQPESKVTVVSIDPSPTRFAGLIVAELDRSNPNFNADILEVVREKMSVHDIISHLDRVLDTYGPEYFIFEQNAAQRWFLQDREMERIRQRIRVVPHTTNKNKADSVLGVEALASDFEFGRIRFPYGDAESKFMSEMLFEEARTFPNGRTDDLLMALWFIKYNYIRLVPNNGLDGGVNFGRAIPRRLAGGWQWWQEAQRKRSGAHLEVPAGASFRELSKYRDFESEARSG